MPRMFTLRAVFIVESLMLIGLINVSRMDGASKMALNLSGFAAIALLLNQSMASSALPRSIVASTV